ncbi:MAG TPA: hypothetical protein VK539_07100 [Myxococcaceae bacterium]|nr:hypothetical protein [Myxococcaceae bacterium]
MPHSTAKYPFEAGLLGWVQEFRQEAGFLAVFGPTGELLKVHEADIVQSGNRLVSHERKKQLIQVHLSWIYYDPFEWPEYAWLKWHQVPRAVLNQMIDKFRLPPLPQGSGDPQELPESWGVMF